MNVAHPTAREQLADNVQLTSLSNGLRVVTQSMPSVETVSLGAWINTGTRHETPDINGISHLLEHMAFKGTEKRSAAQIAEEIEDVGGHMNAYTSRENTAFFVKVLKEDIALGVDLIADILQYSTFDEDELVKEKSVVVQEIAQSIDTPDDIVFDHFQSAAYPDQPMGRPVLGTEQTVREMERQHLVGFMGNTYTPDRMVIAAAGRLDHDSLVAQVTRDFAALPQTTAPEAAPAVYQGGEYNEVRDIEQVHVLLGFDGISYNHPDYYAMSVMATLFGGGMSSRLFQEIREKRGLVYSIYGFTNTFHDTGMFSIYAGTGREDMDTMMPVMLDELKRLPGSVTPAELARARAQLKASVLMGLESTSSRCEQLARQMLVFNRPIPTAEVVDHIESVTAADIDRVSERLLATAPTLAILGPEVKGWTLNKVQDLLAA